MTSWRSADVVAIDTETTGLEPFGGDRVIEVAIVRLRADSHGRAVVLDEWSTFVNPCRDIPRKVTEITGISERDVADAPTFEQIGHEVARRIRGTVAVAHNFPFDLAFLSRELKIASDLREDPSLVWPEPLAEIDTIDLSMQIWPDAKSHRLSEVVSRCGLKLERAHRATDDARASGECFLELARRHEVADDLQSLLEWSNAIGRPPPGSPFREDQYGKIVFDGGPHDGQVVSREPLYLVWMEKALQREEGAWRHVFSEATRKWVRRWLDVRGRGRAPAGKKTFGKNDWVPDAIVMRS